MRSVEPVIQRTPATPGRPSAPRSPAARRSGMPASLGKLAVTFLDRHVVQRRRVPAAIAPPARYRSASAHRLRTSLRRRHCPNTLSSFNTFPANCAGRAPVYLSGPGTYPGAAASLPSRCGGGRGVADITIPPRNCRRLLIRFALLSLVRCGSTRANNEVPGHAPIAAAHATRFRPHCRQADPRTRTKLARVIDLPTTPPDLRVRLVARWPR
jgi:hypothetical protein